MNGGKKEARFKQFVQTQEKPGSGKLKCNIDAVIFSQRTQYGISIWIRDDSGSFVRAKTVVHSSFVSFEGGSIRVLWGAGLLAGIGCSKSQHRAGLWGRVVDGNKGNQTNVTEFGSILQRCKNIIRHLQNLRVSFIMWQASIKDSRFYASSQVFDVIPESQLYCKFDLKWNAI